MLSNIEHSKNIGWSTPLPKGLHAVSDWLPLIPFGIFTRHPQGVQKLAKSEANEVVHYFNSLGGLIARCFQGLPVFTDYKELCGSISYLEIRDNAIWGVITWNKLGQNLMQESSNWFINPIWMTRSENKDVYTPFKLLELVLSHESNVTIYTPKPKRKTILNKKSITENLIGKNNALSNTSRDQFLALVGDHMKKTGDDYLQSWSAIKQTHPHLYQNI